MLIIALPLLIAYSLATFGAVQAHASLLLAIVLISVIAVYLIGSALRDSRWSSAHLILLAAATCAFAMRWQLGAAVVVGTLAWVAATNNDGKTMQFLNVLVLIGIAESALGMVQNFVSPGWIFGYINTNSSVSGTLINRNHFAGLLEMLIPAALGLAYVAARRSGDMAKPYVYLLAGAFMGVALLLSVSRAGIFCFFMTLLFLAILLQLRKSQRRGALGLPLTIGALVTAGALWIGVDVVVQRYSQLLGEEAILREGRFAVYRDATRMMIANPFGIGSRTFSDRFREYQTFRPELLFDHAHNDYIETAAEWGIPASLVFWICIGVVFVRAVRLFTSIYSPEHRGILLACIGAMFSILVHSLTDFNLQIPSNAMLFFTFCGLSLAVRIPESETYSVPR